MRNKKLIEAVEKRAIAHQEKMAKCKHEFVHVSKTGWWGCEITIYCKKCGIR